MPQSNEDLTAIEDFNAAVTAAMRPGVSRLEAVQRVQLSKPDLHKRYLIATNGGKRNRRLVEEKFDSAE